MKQDLQKRPTCMKRNLHNVLKKRKRDQPTLSRLSVTSRSCPSTTHCNILQHTAMTCNTLQHIATHCSTLQHTTIDCSALQCTATHCNTLQHTAAHCSTLQCSATHCNVLQHTATHCSTLQHTAI